MKCPECGKECEKTRPWKRFCSTACGQAQRNRRRHRRVKKALAQTQQAIKQVEGAIV
jgi:hypothetical protein